MKLFTDICESVEPLIESKAGGEKKYFIEGTFMQADTPNKNGRIYPRTIMESQITKYQKLIDAKRSLSELGHPDNPSINLDKVSHLITELRMTPNGKEVYGKAKILDTPMGKIAKSFLDEGVKLGVSSRGLGSLTEKNGIKFVGDDFHLVGIDIVSDPSGPDCWVNAIMENAEWVYNASAKSWIQAEAVKREIRGMSAKQLAERQSDMLIHFLAHLK